MHVQSCCFNHRNNSFLTLSLWSSSMKVNKKSFSHFSLSAHAQNLCACRGHAMWQKRRKQNKILQTTSGHFSQLVLTFLLENPICCMSYHSKDVNSRGIKHFKGRKQPSFYFSRSRQSLARAKKNVYVRETVFSHFKKRELTLLPWFVSFVHTEWTNFSN